MTEAGYERLNAASEDYGSVSEYVRKSCLAQSERVGEKGIASSPKSRQALKEMMVELRSLNMQIQKVGINLNQTSKNIHFLERHGLGDVNIIGRLTQNYIQVQSCLLEADKSLRELIYKFTKR